MFLRRASSHFRIPSRKMSTAVPVPSTPVAVINEALTRKVGVGTVGYIPPEERMTLKEKFILFWKNLYVDYRDVAIETFQNAKAKPTKATIYISLIGTIFYARQSNPKEDSYFGELTKYDTEVSFVSPAIRNPHAETYAQSILKQKIKGELRYQNFELFSVIWRHDVDKQVGIFEATCNYLKPLWSESTERFVDIGAFGKWWMLERRMRDYDVNPNEWDREIMQINQQRMEELKNS